MKMGTYLLLETESELMRKRVMMCMNIIIIVRTAKEY